MSDFAGVLDAQTQKPARQSLEKLKEKARSNFTLRPSIQLANSKLPNSRNNSHATGTIGVKTSRSKDSVARCVGSVEDFFHSIQPRCATHLPEGVLGEMSYRMQGPLSDGRFTEAVDGGVHVFVNALAEKFAFNAADLESRTCCDRQS